MARNANTGIKKRKHPRYTLGAVARELEDQKGNLQAVDRQEARETRERLARNKALYESMNEEGQAHWRANGFSIPS